METSFFNSDHQIPLYISVDEFENNYKIDYSQFEKKYSLSFFLRECILRCRRELAIGGLMVVKEGIDPIILSSANKEELLETIEHIHKVINTELEYDDDEKAGNTPYKLAMLIELGVMDTLNSMYDNQKSKLYLILKYITGCDKGLIKKYWLSKYGTNYNGNEKISKRHFDDIRSKKLLE